MVKLGVNSMLKKLLSALKGSMPTVVAIFVAGVIFNELGKKGRAGSFVKSVVDTFRGGFSG